MFLWKINNAIKPVFIKRKDSWSLNENLNWHHHKMIFYYCSWLYIYILPSSTYWFRLFVSAFVFSVSMATPLMLWKKIQVYVNVLLTTDLCIYIHDFRSERISKSAMGNTWISDISPISIKSIPSVGTRYDQIESRVVVCVVVLSITQIIEQKAFF